ncbi:hypothetical protein JTB14_019177 [Gonioctena quinquepunctata]|nr:hypothetical protein JTB14_019177 [Gonioctena quinquepunctata]
MSIPVEPEIITKNLPTHIQFLVRQRNAVSREFQQSKNRDKKIELLILIKAIVIEMSSSQPDSLPNFISPGNRRQFEKPTDFFEYLKARYIETDSEGPMLHLKSC